MPFRGKDIIIQSHAVSLSIAIDCVFFHCHYSDPRSAFLSCVSRVVKTIVYSMHGLNWSLKNKKGGRGLAPHTAYTLVASLVASLVSSFPARLFSIGLGPRLANKPYIQHIIISLIKIQT